jgi:uncharacterized protein (TIGR03435 family)
MKQKLLLGWLLASVLQIAGTRPVFEVASIKPNTTSNGVRGDCHGADFDFQDIGAAIPRGRCVITAGRLSHFIAIAYNMAIARIKGGPDFVWGAERFDIEAKAEDPAATHQELMRMLQNLLVERFKLKFHIDTQQLSGHALVVDKNGPKLKESKGDSKLSLVLRGAAINKFDAVDGKNQNLNTLTAQHVTMAQFVDLLSNLPDGGPMIDKTNLNGVYDITLSWEPGESLSGVLQKQLGLRLEAQKVPVDFFMIESAEKPTEN